ncbi:PRAME family member 22 [Myotis davidii]|uniref:PRAME family member 22 n=1 Tax=Myotis davidii TaxID=225400 RepID=L5LQN5_MYODS|nr:PRAME family member 22 [Myotis davidii]
MGKSLPAPRRLLELACQSLLRDEALSIAALEWLPMELFPPLFMAAFTGKHSRVLNSMVQAWSFPCLPLGALMNQRQPYQDILQAVLEGLDALLAQDTRPRKFAPYLGQMGNLHRFLLSHIFTSSHTNLEQEEQPGHLSFPQPAPPPGAQFG